MYDPIHNKPKDAPNSLTLDLGDNALHLTRRDPFGHIFMSLDKGELPEKYQGSYTRFDIAEAEAGKYIDERNKAKAALIEEGKAKVKK